MNDEDVYEHVVEVTKEFGLTIFKQKISVCLRLHSKNPRSRPIFATFVQRDTNFRVMAQKA